MNRRIVGIVAAVLFAAVGTVLLVSFVRGAEQRALAGEEVVEVLVVAEPIERGTPVEQLADRVRTERVPAKVRADGGLEDLERLDGQVTAVALLPGEQVVASRFATPAQLEQDRDVDVPDGLQEVTVALEPERAVGGRLRPGDLVGAVASFAPDVMTYSSSFVLDQLLVTEVQVDQQAAAPAPTGDDETDDGPRTAPSGKLLITLAVDTAAAERLVFAAEHGTVWLTAQDEDTDTDGSEVRDAEGIYR